MHNVLLKSENQADNTIKTPLPLCEFLTELVLSVMEPKKSSIHVRGMAI